MDEYILNADETWSTTFQGEENDTVDKRQKRREEKAMQSYIRNTRKLADDFLFKYKVELVKLATVYDVPDSDVNEIMENVAGSLMENIDLVITEPDD